MQRAVPPEITVLSHHKSGTVAAFAIQAMMCCRVPKASMYDGTFHRKWATCKQTCAAHGIYADSAGDFGLNWVEPTRPDRGVQLFPLRWYGIRNKTVIHLVRHPVNMVLSGYFYHKQCAEPHWTQTWDFRR